ncbi:hypothetical protein [Psychroflexus sediminis]|uniref:Pentapeptide repeat-containing protein n=1 Tax=Psychroflexus sediminis TaxID=470826 RepID=A0A1G7XE42_9FLAO|nr:hypothetical protein [Psychroflexus sediminis]SDG82331.1 hypothetical protein SAMN04488027_10846 [Psychroflexus sediminis]
MENREIFNYDKLEISTVTKKSNGTQFVSVGDFNHLSDVQFEFSVSELFETRLKKIGVNSTDKIEFVNIIFRNKFTFTNREIFQPALEFVKCYFYFNPSFTDKTFENKIKFKLCEFERFYINNAKFDEYVKFYNCLFFEKAIISKCSFNDNVVFTKSTFHGNCLFTYSNFEKLGIFSRTKFHDKDENPTALDLSQAIINGQLIFFETVLGDYKAFKIDSSSINFDKTINEGDVIPIQNKRETFRIIKDQLLQQNNIIEAERYAKLEKQTLWTETYKDFKIKNTSNLILLSLNKISNNYKTNWLYGLVFTIVIAFICHIILSISDVYKFSEFKNLAKLVNVADFSFYEKKDISPRLYAAYFLAKISIGFGIYQLIQAFRKYK